MAFVERVVRTSTHSYTDEQPVTVRQSQANLLSSASTSTSRTAKAAMDVWRGSERDLQDLNSRLEGYIAHRRKVKKNSTRFFQMQERSTSLEHELEEFRKFHQAEMARLRAQCDGELLSLRNQRDITLETTVTRLQTQLHDADAARALLQTEVDSRRQRESDVQGELASVRAALQRSEQSTHHLQTQVERLTRELQESTGDNGRLCAEVERVSSQLRLVTDEAAQRQSRENTTHSQTYARLEMEIERLKREHTQELARQREHSNELARVRESKSTLDRALQQERSERVRQEHVISEQRSDYERLVTASNVLRDEIERYRKLLRLEEERIGYTFSSQLGSNVQMKRTAAATTTTATATTNTTRTSVAKAYDELERGRVKLEQRAQPPNTMGRAREHVNYAATHTTGAIAAVPRRASTVRQALEHAYTALSESHAHSSSETYSVGQLSSCARTEGPISIDEVDQEGRFIRIASDSVGGQKTQSLRGWQLRVASDTNSAPAVFAFRSTTVLPQGRAYTVYTGRSSRPPRSITGPLETYWKGAPRWTASAPFHCELVNADGTVISLVSGNICATQAHSHTRLPPITQAQPVGGAGRELII